MAYVNHHLELFLAYKKAHPELKPQQAQINTNIIWKDAKNEFKRRKPDFVAYIRGIIEQLNRETENREAGVSSYTPQLPYIPSIPQGTVKPQPPACSYAPVMTPAVYQPALPFQLDEPLKPVKREFPVTLSDEDDDPDSPRRRYNTPAQDTIRGQIALLESELNSATLTRNSGLAGPEIDTKIDQLFRSLEEERRKLSKAEENAKRQKTHRVKVKNTFSQLLTLQQQTNSSPEIGIDEWKSLGLAPGPGRPKLPDESEPPKIVRVAVEIARFGGFIDARKCEDIVKKCRSSDDVDKELHKFGLRLQKCDRYFRLLPVGFSPEQGLRYETTVPVRLCHAQTGKEHVDQKFCAATINSLECLASILGSKQVAMVSQDSRARVPLAISAAGQQAPILLRMEYHDCPDQEFVAPCRHKLYLNVFAGITVQDELMGVAEAVGFSGPTYISIRLGFLGLAAASNAVDLERLMWLPAFHDMMRVDGKLKPVLMLTVYGGPDESPRYPQAVHQAVHVFRKYELDAVYVAVAAPGKSSGNRVERRLAPLSRELFGVVLPHDPYGRHLSDAGAIVDDVLETRNLELVANILCETWGRFVIDGHPVVAEFVAHKGENLGFDTSSWYSTHVRESQYLLQIVKCGDVSCCSPMRSNLKNALLTGFLPGPYPLKRTRAGLVIPSPAEITGDEDFPSLTVRQMVNLRPASLGNALPPYDQYCPSMRSQILGRTCHLCGVYFASKKSAYLHAQGVHKSLTVPAPKVRPRMILAHRKKEILCLMEDPTTGAQDAEWLDEEDVDLVGLSIPEPPQSSVIPIIGDKLSDWVQFSWLPDV